MTPTEQDKELRDLLEQNGWKFYEELNGFRKESRFTIMMFSTDQSKSYDALSAGNYYELAQLIIADRKKYELQAQLKYIEYLDQIPSNEVMDWKGLLADNKRLIEQELEKL